MKYIRTKDKIIDISNFEIKREIYENGELKFYEFWTTRFIDKQVIQLFANEIINQADTIDKLCDTFVICVDKQGYLIIDDYKKAMEIMQRNDNYNAICYGAIWCEWGLKYVAKMNRDCKLELECCVIDD